VWTEHFICPKSEEPKPSTAFLKLQVCLIF
jgi:hypothetical protein